MVEECGAPDGRAAVNAGMWIIFAIICVILPPAVVAIRKGFGAEFVLNLVLTLVFWVPGAIHALYVVFKTDGTKSIA